MMRDKHGAILIIDDMPSNIHTLSAVLKDNYDLYVATNGEKAIDLCRRKLPDLVLLDVSMPGMTGYDVCAVLKQDALVRDIPVIFVTAHDAMEDEMRGLEAGAIDFITKPISAAIVQARVRNHIRLKRQADQLRALSMQDGLTGLANRRHFDERLERAWRRAARTGGPLSLILLDIDHFKAFNDRYGHQQGDECLRSVARLVAAQLGRPDDLAARYGGEELVCLLPETDADGAGTIARRILQAVRSAGIPHLGSSVADHVTVSIGVATARCRDGQPTSELLALADRRLYQAKRDGRDRLYLDTANVSDRAGK